MSRAVTAPVGAILLTGATGFVGSALHPALARRGPVRCLTRDAARARARLLRLDWVEGDVADEAACARALDGCSAAFYLVHSIGEQGDFRRREVEAARRFARAADGAGLRRIVYLGGVAPAALASEHLRSRLEVGEALRAGPVLTVELRASMIIGHGSLSWLIVRDLAARLPVMVLPRWLRSRTEPVAIEDVVVALTGALELPLEASAWFDLPGPEVLSAEQILVETARAMGLPPPLRFSVPVLRCARDSSAEEAPARARRRRGALCMIPGCARRSSSASSGAAGSTSSRRDIRVAGCCTRPSAAGSEWSCTGLRSQVFRKLTGRSAVW